MKRERNGTKERETRDQNAKASGLPPRTPLSTTFEFKNFKPRRILTIIVARREFFLKNLDLIDEFTHQSKIRPCESLSSSSPRREKSVSFFWFVFFLCNDIKERK